MIRILGTLFAGLLGLCFGSFLNVCLSRWPEQENVVQPRSHCRHCPHTLALWENIPLLSWLLLRGRCRNCRAWIGWRYPLVELSVGILWALLMRSALPIRYDYLAPFYVMLMILLGAISQMVFVWILIALAALDTEHLWLPNMITYPGITLGVIVTITSRFVFGLYSDDLTVPYLSPIWSAIFVSLISVILAAALILLIRWIYWLIRKQEGLGLGDAKLMALLAAWLGLPLTLLSFVLAIFLGSLTAVALLAIPSAKRASPNWAMSKLPLGTFLCIGGIVSSLWGQPILNAYLRWAGF